MPRCTACAPCFTVVGVMGNGKYVPTSSNPAPSFVGVVKRGTLLKICSVVGNERKPRMSNPCPMSPANPGMAAADPRRTDSKLDAPSP